MGRTPYLQAVREEDPVQGPVRVSKLDVIDAYHCSTINPSQVGASVYAIPSAPENKGIIFCINLVLPMGWVDSQKFSARFWKL